MAEKRLGFKRNRRPIDGSWGAIDAKRLGQEDHLSSRQLENVDVPPPTSTPTQTLRASSATKHDVTVAQADASAVDAYMKGADVMKECCGALA